LQSRRAHLIPVRSHPTSSPPRSQLPCDSSLRSINRRGLQWNRPVRSKWRVRPFRFDRVGLEEHPQHLEEQTTAEHEGKQDCTHPALAEHPFLSSPFPLQSLSSPSPVLPRIGLDWIILDWVVLGCVVWEKRTNPPLTNGTLLRPPGFNHHGRLGLPHLLLLRFGEAHVRLALLRCLSLYHHALATFPLLSKASAVLGVLRWVPDWLKVVINGWFGVWEGGRVLA
jgi:hypothetical protein